MPAKPAVSISRSLLWQIGGCDNHIPWHGGGRVLEGYATSSPINTRPTILDGGVEIPSAT
ncbi:MAG: hypothetical protein U1F83_01920 [Verrucomicrobiota bacterium]